VLDDDTPTWSARRLMLISTSGKSSPEGVGMEMAAVQTCCHLVISRPARFAHWRSLTRSAGELNSDELERIVTIMQNPAQFKIPEWFLNRQRDITTGKSGHLLSNVIDQQMRADLERLKKIRSHRGLRHHWGLKVRGQHTCTTYVFSPFVLFLIYPSSFPFLCIHHPSHNS